LHIFKYNTKYKVICDYDLMVKCFQKNYKFQIIDLITVNFIPDGFSTLHFREAMLEGIIILQEHGFSFKVIEKSSWMKTLASRQYNDIANFSFSSQFNKYFQQLKQFTADASHELRSPLTAIKTSVEVMQSHPERIHDADVKKLAAIASATKQMTELVEDLLLLARMDAGTAKITREWIVVPLDEVLEDLLEFWELQAEEKQIALKSNLVSGLSVMGDAAQLTRLFSNLIGNAIHYTSSGGTVTVSLINQNRLVIVNVEDTGIGIDAENVKLVFDRFWRADQARNRRAGGLGMGLAIAQAIAQRHRGEISVTSQLGVGSCFQVKFPY